jgi:cytochrome c biogenesis protein CcmG, thiol:disulfide interchange protein DsbE
MSTAGEATAGTGRRGAHTIRWVMIGLAVLVLLPALAVLGSRIGKDATGVPSVLIGKPAPAFTLSTLDGKTISNADLRGKPYVLNFWASWCPPCRQEHGALRAFWERYRDRGVMLLGVIFNDSPANARAFQDQLGGDWPLLTDPNNQALVDYGVRGPPETFVVNEDGIIVKKFTGPVGPGWLDQVLATETRLARAGG